MTYNIARNTGGSNQKNEVEYMELFIGDNIKRLRRQKGITQETLADRMHVSTAAVSKWERNETFPDIAMVIPLASYFGVSTDELLGLDTAKNEEKIKEYIAESNRLASLGKELDRFELIVKAYNEFPNDWRIIELYMWELNYDPHHREEPFGFEVHKNELYRLCERVLDECNFDQTRYAALSIIGGLYLLDGQKEKAIETARRFPPYWLTQGDELEGCYDCEKEPDEWLRQVQDNIWDLFSALLIKLEKVTLYAKDITPQEQIDNFEKMVSLIKTVFDRGDYGWYHYDLSELYLWIANRFVMINDLDKAFENYELGFSHARAFDALPRITTHTSFLLKGKTFDITKINSSTEMNMVAMQIERLLSWGVYEKVKDTPQMKALLTKYKPFAGKKKEYS